MSSLQFYLQVFIYSIVVVVAAFMAMTISKRDRTRLSETLFWFFIIIAVGTSFSVIVRLINDLEFKNILIILVPVVVGCAIPQLTFFLLFIERGAGSYSVAKQVVFSLIYFLLLVVLFFIPGGSTFEMDATGSMQPAWSLGFMLYGCIVQQILFTYNIIITGRIVKTMEDPEAKNKLKSVILAIIIFDYILLGTFVVNYINHPMVRSIFAITGLLVFVALFLLYNGLVKQFTKK